MSSRVVITGVGAVTPLGVGARRAPRGLARPAAPASRTASAPCTDFDPTEFMTVKEARRSDRFAQLAIAASTQAVADAGWDVDNPPADPADLGCVIGSGIGGMWTFESQCDVLRDRGPERVSPLAIPLIMGNAAAGLVAMRHDLRGPVFGVMSGVRVRHPRDRRGRADDQIWRGTGGRHGRRRGDAHSAREGRVRRDGRDLDDRASRGRSTRGATAS